jgi:excisionase family DNA binding protein
MGQQMPIEQRVTPREAAQLLGVRLDTIYALIWAGKLQAEKKDGRWLLSVAAIYQRRRPTGMRQGSC